MTSRFQMAAKLILLAAIASIAVGCGGSKKKAKFAYVERPVETLYAEAQYYMDRKRYDEAIGYFEEVERQHPYSAWARRAMLMKAFAYYQGNDYDEAVDALDQFIGLHPGNKDVGYAYYLKAMCHYERIRDVGRDQEFTNNAVASLTDVVRRFPDTEYARDARLKLDLTHDHLAGKEMYVGRYYLKDNKHISAINRFKRVITDYQTTNHVPEALHRLVEAYLELGIIEEARAAAAVLGYNYPGSRWYQDTYRLFERRGILEEGTRAPQRAKNDAAVEDPNDILRDLDPDTLEAQAPPNPDELEELAADHNDLGEDFEAEGDDILQ